MPDADHRRPPGQPGSQCWRSRARRRARSSARAWVIRKLRG